MLCIDFTEQNHNSHAFSYSAPLGEVVTFEGLPAPIPASPAQVEKKKIFALCMDGMKTNDDCVGTWNGHVFMTSAGPCKGRTVKGGAMR